MVEMRKRKGYCRNCGRWGHWADTCIVKSGSGYKKSYYSNKKKQNWR